MPEVGTSNSFVPTTLPTVYYAIMHTNASPAAAALKKNAKLYVEVFKDADTHAALKQAQARFEVLQLNYTTAAEKYEATQPGVTRLLLRVTALNENVIIEEKILRQIPVESILK